MASGPSTSTSEAAFIDRRQQRLHACGQLGVLERLHEVVVGTRLEARDLVLPAAARGEDEDGQRAAFAAQPLHHVDAAQLRQAEVDDGEIDGVLRGLEQAVFAVGRVVDAIAFGLELAGEAEPQGGVVLGSAGRAWRSASDRSQPTTRPLAASTTTTRTLALGAEDLHAPHRPGTLDREHATGGHALRHGGGFIAAHVGPGGQGPRRTSVRKAPCEARCAKRPWGTCSCAHRPTGSTDTRTGTNAPGWSCISVWKRWPRYS